MKLISAKKYLKAWSTWVLGLITVTPAISNEGQWLFGFIPAEYQGVAVSVLGAIGLLVRAIKQK